MRKTDNPFTILNLIRHQKYPVNVVLKGGRERTVNSGLELHVVLTGHEESFRIEGDLVTVTKDGFPTIRLYDAVNNGDLLTIFIRNEYDFLDVGGMTVIDVGANIGDSSVYFALRGAKKVIGLEPFIKNCQTAERNVLENNLAGKIQILQAGCMGEKGSAKIDEDESGTTSKLSDTGRSKVPLVTLEELAAKEKDERLVLKMDCEGCEYESILRCPDHVLKRFEQILIEYHYGYKDLEEKLKKCGFETDISDPRHYKSSFAGERSVFVGSIHATRVDQNRYGDHAKTSRSIQS